MKLAIIGSRDFTDYDLLSKELEQYKDKITRVISGGAKGADTLGERWAKENNIPIQIFLPDWNKHSKGAGLLRNHDIIKNDLTKNKQRPRDLIKMSIKKDKTFCGFNWKYKYE